MSFRVLEALVGILSWSAVIQATVTCETTLVWWTTRVGVLLVEVVVSFVLP